MTAATALPVSPAASRGRVFPRVLAGVELNGPAARLARVTDPAFLAEAGWDPAARVLSLPAAHPLLGRTLCRAGGCPATAHAATPGLCWSCFARLRRAGMTAEQIAASPAGAGPAAPPGPLPGAALRADVPGRAAGAADRAVRGALAQVPPDAGDDDRAVPG
jgi:hypothetical protein